MQSGKFHCHSSSGTCFADTEDWQSWDPVRILSTRQCRILSQCKNYCRFTCHPVVIWCFCPCSRVFRPPRDAISIQRWESLSSRFYFSKSNPVWLSLTFCDGNFKASGKPTKSCVGTSKESLVEVKETRDEQEAAKKAIYSCPKDGCTHTF